MRFGDLFKKNTQQSANPKPSHDGLSVKEVVETQAAFYQRFFSTEVEQSQSDDFAKAYCDAKAAAPGKMESFLAACPASATCSHNQMDWLRRAMDFVLFKDCIYYYDKGLDTEIVCAYMRSLDGTQAPWNPIPGRAQFDIIRANLDAENGNQAYLVPMINATASASSELISEAVDVCKKAGFMGPSAGEYGQLWAPSKIAAFLQVATKINAQSKGNGQEVTESEMESLCSPRRRHYDSPWDERLSAEHKAQLIQIERYLASLAPRFTQPFVDHWSSLRDPSSALTGLIRTCDDIIPVVKGEPVICLYAAADPHTYFGAGKMRNMEVIDGKVNGSVEFVTLGNPISAPVIDGVVHLSLDCEPSPYWGTTIRFGSGFNCDEARNIGGDLVGVVNDALFMQGRFVEELDGRPIARFLGLHFVNGKINGCAASSQGRAIPVVDGHFLDIIDGEEIKGCGALFNDNGHLYGLVSIHDEASPYITKESACLLVDGKLIREINGSAISSDQTPPEEWHCFPERRTLYLSLRDSGYCHVYFGDTVYVWNDKDRKPRPLF